MASSKRRGKDETGQLLIVGFSNTKMSSRLASLLATIQPAGVILFARNIKNPEQTWRLLRDCQKCVTTPLFTCVDLEGGTVDRFRATLGSAPSAREVFQTGDRKLFRRHGQIIGENCRSMGFNVDFAPVLDLAFEASHSVMESRAVSANPGETIAYAREFLAGLRAANVMGCGKHFPGLGEGKLDSHRQLPVIDKPLEKLWAEDLLPYRTLRSLMPRIRRSRATKLQHRFPNRGSRIFCASASATEISSCRMIWRWAGCNRRSQLPKQPWSLFVRVGIYA